MNNLENYIGQRRIWVSKPDDGFAEEFIGRIFRISGIKRDMSNVMYFTYYYGKIERYNKREVKEVLYHSAEVSPVMEELFDI